MASLVLSIGSISLLNRRDELIVPSWSSVATTTGTPGRFVVTPLIPLINVLEVDGCPIRMAFDSPAVPLSPDVDIVVAGSAIVAGVKAYGDVVGASGVAMECVSANGRVIVASAARVINKRIRPVGCIAGAAGVRGERLKTVGRVVVADRTVTERANPGCRVV